MPWTRNNKPGPMERAVSALCYVTGGIAGIIYIIISRSNYQSEFFRFHFLQSIVLVILTMLLNWALQAFSLIAGTAISGLAGVMGAAADTVTMIVQFINVAFNYAWLVYGLIPLYGLIFAALGKYAEIPFLSNVVRNQMR